MDHLPETPTHGCSIMEKEENHLLFRLHSKEARIELKSINLRQGDPLKSRN